MNDIKKLICVASGKEMVAVRRDDLLSVAADMKKLCDMLTVLIALIQKEEKLKQHHRPYLHLRREMLGICENNLRTMTEIKVRTSSSMCGCSFECCLDGCDTEAQKTDTENTAFYDMLDDLLVLAEHTGNLGNFVKLLMSGVNLGDTPAVYDETVQKVIEEMLERWENYMENVDVS